MKVGIISNFEWLKQWSNYGTLFQNYALQKGLQKLGHQSYWIRTSSHERRTKAERLTNLFLQIRHQPIDLVKRSCRNILATASADGKETEIQIFNRKFPRHFDEFMQRWMNTTEIEYDIEMLRIDPPAADAYIVGSDNVWADVSPTSFLDFGPSDVRRVSYAVSAPWASLSSYWYAKASREVSRIHRLSVREADGLAVCARLGRNDVSHVLDPTLLLLMKDYMDLIDASPEESACAGPSALGYLINVTSLSEIPWNCLESYAKEHSLALKVVPLQGTELVIPDKHVICPSPIGWLKWYCQSECVITNSFHGTIFSIIFRKPFIVLSKGMNGTGGGSVRFHSLLSSLGLEDRIFSGTAVNDFTAVMARQIDWEAVETKLDLYRQKSFEYLSMSLS